MDWKAFFKSRDSVLWPILMYVGLIVSALAMLTDPAYYGIPPWLMPYIRLGALIAAVVGGKNGNSALPGVKSTGVLLLLFVLATTTACGPKVVATQVDLGVLKVLGMVQDTELVLYKAGAIQKADHDAFKVKLVTALELGRKYNTVVRDWPQGAPAPAEVKQLTVSLSAMIIDVVKIFPGGADKDRVVAEITKVQQKITEFLAGGA